MPYLIAYAMLREAHSTKKVWFINTIDCSSDLVFAVPRPYLGLIWAVTHE